MTPPGTGGVAVVAFIGEGTDSAIRSVFRGKRSYGWLEFEGQPVDEVVIQTIPPESSFTGEETVEIGCHGGLAPIRKVIELCERLGARPIPWETLVGRARRRGKIDIWQHEAYLLLPGALTPLAARTILDQTQGRLPRYVAGATRSELEELMKTAPIGRALCEPRRVVIVGRPNVGKSTLFNALVREERALVHATPGTTRDPVEEMVSIGGFPIRLLDTAGIELARDPLEREAIDRTRRRLQNAHAVILVTSTDLPVIPPDIPEVPTLRVENKGDLGGPIRPDWIRVSALQNEGIDQITHSLLQILGLSPPTEGSPVILTETQEKRILGLICATHRVC